MEAVRECSRNKTPLVIGRFFGTLVGVRNYFRSLFATFGMKELLVIRLATVA